MAIYKLPLLLDPQPEGGYVVTSPVLPELIAEGDTVQEALTNAQDALAAVIEAYEDLGRPLPAALQPAAEQTPLEVEIAFAVPPSARDTERLKPKKLSLSEAIQRFRATHDLSDMTDIDEIFADVRDKSPGREIDL